MGTSSKRNFFVQNGKALRITSSDSIRKEKVTSLFDGQFVSTIQKNNLLVQFVGGFKKRIQGLSATSLAIPSGLVLSGLIFSLIVKNFIPAHADNKYSIFSSKPLTLTQSRQEVTSKDSRSQKINEVFKYYKCPLEGLGEIFVREADENDIPWWLVASVAFQESSCGKNTPKVDGQESYNAWGWGIYGDNLHTFDNWARGIEVVSEYFNNKFYSKGITETCDIMKVYTPPSNGSWCEGVNHFADIIQAYKTP